MEQSFGAFLRERRKENNLTQKELANLLFVSESAVSKWEKDVARPDIILLPKLCEILGVTEHELLTASIDKKARVEKQQARRWRILSFSWSLFFYIAYVAALIPCFICNLAIDKTLSWFWIVASALLLSFTFTNLPTLIKKNRLLLLPLSQYLSLVLLLFVCCIYTGGNWFFIASVSVFTGLVIVLGPIYIAKYDVFSKLRKFNDFISVGIDFIVLNLLLLVINLFTLTNGYSADWWYITIALPILIALYCVLNVLLCVRFIKVNNFIKSSIILFIINIVLYIPPIFIKVDNPYIQKEIDDINIFMADLSRWQVGVTLENNIHLLISLTLLLLACSFLIVGIVVKCYRKRGK